MNYSSKKLFSLATDLSKKYIFYINKFSSKVESEKYQFLSLAEKVKEEDFDEEYDSNMPALARQLANELARELKNTPQYPFLQNFNRATADEEDLVHIGELAYALENNTLFVNNIKNILKKYEIYINDIDFIKDMVLNFKLIIESGVYGEMKSSVSDIVMKVFFGQIFKKYFNNIYEIILNYYGNIYYSSDAYNDTTDNRQILNEEESIGNYELIRLINNSEIDKLKSLIINSGPEELFNIYFFLSKKPEVFNTLKDFFFQRISLESEESYLHKWTQEAILQDLSDKTYIEIIKKIISMYKGNIQDTLYFLNQGQPKPEKIFSYIATIINSNPNLLSSDDFRYLYNAYDYNKWISLQKLFTNNTLRQLLINYSSQYPIEYSIFYLSLLNKKEIDKEITDKIFNSKLLPIIKKIVNKIEDVNPSIDLISKPISFKNFPKELKDKITEIILLSVRNMEDLYSIVVPKIKKQIYSFYNISKYDDHTAKYDDDFSSIENVINNLINSSTDIFKNYTNYWINSKFKKELKNQNKNINLSEENNDSIIKNLLKESLNNDNYSGYLSICNMILLQARSNLYKFIREFLWTDIKYMRGHIIDNKLNIENTESKDLEKYSITTENFSFNEYLNIYKNIKKISDKDFYNQIKNDALMSNLQLVNNNILIEDVGYAADLNNLVRLGFLEDAAKKSQNIDQYLKYITRLSSAAKLTHNSSINDELLKKIFLNPTIDLNENYASQFAYIDTILTDPEKFLYSTILDAYKKYKQFLKPNFVQNIKKFIEIKNNFYNAKANLKRENIDVIKSLYSDLKKIVEFDKYQEYVQLAKPKDKKIFELELDLGDYKFSVLKDLDPRHFDMGTETQCCQFIGGQGEAAAIDSFINPLAGVLILEDNNKKIISQSYFHYVPQDNGYILDNIEVSSELSNDETTNIYSMYASMMKNEKPDIKYIKLGLGGTKIDYSVFNMSSIEEDPRHFEWNKYTDFSPRDHVDLFSPKDKEETILKPSKIKTNRISDIGVEYFKYLENLPPTKQNFVKLIDFYIKNN